ncbi:hypothetical protein GFY24_20075 [Nocardia sp. SYP-A9097]|uniref:hypothetical protein n=1 Tax=Nocardia sp. SYP-A9097 TaxID=2663237 RepID=UPI00129B6CE7|nr:hypothetical protein [Nocardia sp. SYP-A9097]MRH89714.1 hypothetical protein [Nocardia sp. SYP-A9097]
MRTENINRKFKLHDERRIAAQLPEQLQGLDVVGFVRVDEFPAELLNSFGEFAGAAVEPYTRIYRNAQPNRIDAWLLELLRHGRIGDRFFLRTGLEYFPWADCRVLDHRWLESLRRVIGPNQGFISADKTSAAMTIGAQYEMLGFLRPIPPPAAVPPPTENEQTVLLSALPEPPSDNETTVLISRVEAPTQRITREPAPTGEDTAAPDQL